MAPTPWLSRVLGQPVEIPTRTTIDEMVASRQWLESLWKDVDYGTDVSIRPETLATLDDREVPGEVLEPTDGDPVGVVVSIHGGGWVLGSARSDRIWNARLARAGFRVLSPDYGLAPENPFPVPVLDCAAVIGEAHSVAKALELGNVAVLGYSAGANLAAAAVAAILSQHALLAGMPIPAGEVRMRLGLYYGIYDFESLVGDPAGVSTTAELWKDAYLGAAAVDLLSHPLVSPIHASDTLASIPIYLACGRQDRLVGQTVALIEALRAVGVTPDADLPSELDHGFLKTVRTGRAEESVFDTTYAWCRGETATDV